MNRLTAADQLMWWPAISVWRAGPKTGRATAAPPLAADVRARSEQHQGPARRSPHGAMSRVKEEW